MTGTEYEGHREASRSLAGLRFSRTLYRVPRT